MSVARRQPWVTRLYRSALRLLPAQFRERFGPEMLELFEARLARRSGTLAGLLGKSIIDLVRTAWRERPSRNGMGDVIRTDVTTALRALRVTPGNTLTALTVLTFAIAAATVTFSIVDAIAIRRLPFAEPNRLVSLARLESKAARPGLIAPQDLYAWQADVPAFESIGGIGESSLTLSSAGQTESLAAYSTTASLFTVLRVAPFLGRPFSSEDETAGSNKVVLISHALWQRRFGANPAVVGQPHVFGTTSGQDSLTVIGVMPEGFTYPVHAARPADAWIPFVPGPRDRDHASQGRAFVLSAVGRLRSDAALAAARAQVEQVTTRLTADYQSVSWQSARAVVMPLQHWVVGPARQWLILALIAVGLVLLVSYVNAANLLLARAVGRGRELTTRAALGASRSRLARALLFEVLLLSAAASALGLLLSVWSLSAVTSLLPAGLARASTIALDTRVLVIAVAVTFGLGLIFGALPACQASRATLGLAARATSSSSSRWQGPLVIAQVAFVVTLLVATTLAVTTFVRVMATDLGFDPHNVVSFTVSKDLAAVPSANRPAAAEVWQRELADRIRAVPGVTGVSFIGYGGMPMTDMSTLDKVVVSGFGVTSDDDMAEVRKIAPGYFKVLGMRLVRGRGIEESDRAGTPQVAVINQTAARRYFGDLDPIGQPVTSATDWSFTGSATVVGVVDSVRLIGPEQDLRPEMYLAIAQDHRRASRLLVDVVVRTSQAPELTVSAIQAAMRSVLGASARLAPRYPWERLRSLTAERRFNAGLMSVLGVFAIMIASLGVYGVMSFIAAGQVRDIAVRMALGASPVSILRGMLWQAGRYLAPGVLIGLAGAYFASSLLTVLVFDLSPAEPLIYLLVAIVVALVGVTAALGPSVRAARVDPILTLRSE